MAFSHAKQKEKDRGPDDFAALGMSFHNPNASTRLPSLDDWLHSGTLYKHVISSEGECCRDVMHA